MKTLKVPHQHISGYETIFDKIKLLHEAGAEAIIEQVNWKKEFPKKIPVSVRVAHDGEKIYLLYNVKGERLHAATIEDFGPVWEDSCVEFFMQREGEEKYRNFECNVLGALLAAKRFDRNSPERLVDEMPSIVRQTFIEHKYENGIQMSDWSAYLEIPKKAMGFAEAESLSGQKLRANFYKCGDKTPEPHFISWNLIETPSPNFHAPQFFGILELE